MPITFRLYVRTNYNAKQTTLMESNAFNLILAILAVLIPIAIILYTISAFRKNRARGEEKTEGHTFTSVKEERLKKDNKM